MRKFLSLLVVLLTTVATATNAQILVEGIYYTFNDTEHTAKVTAGTDKYTGTLNIPEKVTYNSSEYTVTKIDEDCFLENTELVSVTIPNTVQLIMAGAFDKCSGLTTVIIGSSVGLIGDDAFRGCTSLTSVYDYATEPQDLSYCNPSPFKDSNISNCTLYVPQASKSKYEAAIYWKDFKEIKEAPAPNYLCFTAEEAAAKVSFSVTDWLSAGWTPAAVLQYTTDTQTWTDYTYGAEVPAAGMAIGDKIYFRAKTAQNSFSNSPSQFVSFTATKKIAASGNIMSLIDPTCQSSKVPAKAFYSLFDDCSNLTMAPSLPALELGEGCYSQMFNNCTNLAIAPSLPATKLGGSCYNYMFNGCISLTSVPVLSATDLTGDSNYDSMFSYCYAIKLNTTAPGLEWSLPSGVDASQVRYMFNYTGGSFKEAPVAGTTYYIASLPAVQLNSKGYATYSSAQNVDIATEGVTAYTATVSGSTITLNAIGSDKYIPAGMPVVLYGGDAMANKVVTFKTPVNTAAASTTDDALKSTLVAGSTAGAYKVDAKPSTGFTFALGDGSTFLHYTGSAFIANRAYFNLDTDPTVSSGAKALTIVFGDETTAINNVNANPNANQAREGKYIENGRIVILQRSSSAGFDFRQRDESKGYDSKNGKKYNTAGQQVK